MNDLPDIPDDGAIPTPHGIISAAALDALEFPPISYVVHGLIVEGLTILAGKPKFGKSYLALQLLSKGMCFMSPARTISAACSGD